MATSSLKSPKPKRCYAPLVRFFYKATEELWKQALTGEVTLGATMLMRLAATNAARQGAEVCRLASGLAGTEALYTAGTLARAMCDSFVVAQHAALNEGTLQSAGRALLGSEIQPGYP
ncbi:hypothetical protein [Bradyrhizobium sp. USDA 4472]